VIILYSRSKPEDVGRSWPQNLVLYLLQ
jgi:hypothetical protein